MRRQLDRLVEQRLVLDDAAGLEAAARRQDRPSACSRRCGSQAPWRRSRRTPPNGSRRCRAQASIAIDGLRHHRHVEDDAVALADAEVAQNAGQHLRLGQQPVVRDGDLLLRQRRIVDDRRLRAAPGLHVTIDRVPAGVADAAHEPAPVHAGRWIEYLLGRLDPVDGLRGLAPEALRVALAAGVDLVIAARAGIHDAGLPCWGAIVSGTALFASRTRATDGARRLAQTAGLRFDRDQPPRATRALPPAGTPRDRRSCVSFDHRDRGDADWPLQGRLLRPWRDGAAADVALRAAVAGRRHPAADRDGAGRADDLDLSPRPGAPGT